MNNQGGVDVGAFRQSLQLGNPALIVIVGARQLAFLHPANLVVRRAAELVLQQLASGPVAGAQALPPVLNEFPVLRHMICLRSAPFTVVLLVEPFDRGFVRWGTAGHVGRDLQQRHHRAVQLGVRGDGHQRVIGPYADIAPLIEGKRVFARWDSFA